MGSLWTVELDVDRSRASPIFCGLARGEVRRAGVGVEESRSCELTDWVLLRHGEEPVEGDAIVYTNVPTRVYSEKHAKKERALERFREGDAWVNLFQFSR